jgi:zinc transporter 1/2/3
VLIWGVNITPLILLFALGIHSIFEGIALGMSKSISTFVNLMIGVTLHHAAACISLGVTLGQHQTKSKKAIFFIFFGLSLIESTGIGIGIGINDAPALVSSIVLSISGGTFIYIACSEILIHEFSNNKSRYVKFLFFAIGCACITLLWLLHQH